MKLHFETWGPQTRNPEEKLVLLHGLGGTGALWRPIAATLEENFAMIAPDQRGHGKSRPQTSTTPAFTPLDFGKDLVETLQETGFWPAWVIGHSMGVRSACALAHLRPEFLKGLILIDLGLVGAAGGGLHQNLHAFLQLLPESFASREAARQFMSEKCPDPAIGQYLMAVSTRDKDGTIRFPFDAKSLIHALDQARDVDLRPWIREFASSGKPVVLFRGGSSQVWTHDDFERTRRELQDLPSVHFHEIEGAGHGLPFEKRQTFTAQLLNDIRYRPPRRD